MSLKEIIPVYKKNIQIQNKELLIVERGATYLPLGFKGLNKR
jgi:hypothetical protein